MGGSTSTQVALLGLDTAGKTTCLYRLKFRQYMDTKPTIGFNCEKITVDTGPSRGTVFTVWDFCGNDKTRPLWKSYSRKVDGIIFVVDSTDKERMEEAKIELVKIIRSPDNPGLPFVVLANKQDLPGSMDISEIEKMLSLHELPAAQLWHVEPTCGVTGEGLDEAFEKMSSLILKKKKGKKKS